MRARDSLFVRRCSAALLLCLALLGGDARAARAEVMPQMVADADVMSDSAPVMGDCRPCAHCYTGPVSTVQGFSAESKEQIGRASCRERV